MRVIIVQRIFSNYREPIFNLLAKNVELLVLHSSESSGIKQVITSYSRKVHSFKYAPKDTAIHLMVLPSILKFKPHIIIHEFTPSIISLHISFLISKFLGIKFIVWGHGYNRTKSFNPRKSLSSKIRLFYMRYSDAVILYGYETKNELSKYVSEKKLFVAPNTIDTNRFLDIYKIFDKIGREIIRQRIGFTHLYNILFIGRLLKNKLPDYLILLYEKLILKFPDKIAVHFVGEGEMLIPLQQEVLLKNYSKDFFFHGEIHDDIKSGELLYASDIMVMPGYVGLSVNHAFCFACPVATFKQGPNGPFHSPEIEYIRDNLTGILAKSFDLDDMADRVVEYLQNNELQMKMRSNISNLINTTCSINQMLLGFTNCFKSLSIKK